MLAFSFGCGGSPSRDSTTPQTGRKIFTPKYERKLLSGKGEGASAKASAERS
jgi:hypothetical protein